MINWLLDIIGSIENLIYKASRGTQLIIFLLAGGIAGYNAYGLYVLLVNMSFIVNPAEAIVVGAFTVAAGYLAIVSLVYCLKDSRRRSQAEIAAREAALQRAKDSRGGLTPPLR